MAAMVCEPLPLNSTVFPVFIKVPVVNVAVTVKFPVIKIVPLERVMLFVVLAPLIVRLLNVKTGIGDAPVPLKSTELPVVVYELVPTVHVFAIPIVPEDAKTLAPELLLVRLL